MSFNIQIFGIGLLILLTFVTIAFSTQARVNLHNDAEFERYALSRLRTLKARIAVDSMMLFMNAVFLPMLGADNQWVMLLMSFCWLVILGIDVEMVNGTSHGMTPEAYMSHLRFRQRYAPRIFVAASAVIVAFSFLASYVRQ